MSCGMGIRMRRVYCVDLKTNIVSAFCDQSTKPITIESCWLVEKCPEKEKGSIQMRHFLIKIHI